MTTAITTVNLNKSYAGFQLQDVSLTVPSGCIMGLIGENGAGKSTLIRLILDLARPDSGEISVLGVQAGHVSPEIWNDIGVVMDECCFHEALTVCQLDKILRGIYQAWDSGLFQSYVAKFNLPKKRKVKEFSRGMKMKLSVAVALSHGSRLLILDEATSGLDPIVRDEILEIFYDFIQQEDHSVLISSHILSDLEKICDYITFLHQGKMIFSEEKDRLLEQYRLLKCSAEDFAQLDKAAVVGHRKGQFGVEALVYADKLAKGLRGEKASVEDIMLYHVRQKEGA